MHQGALELDLPLAVTLLLHVVRGLRALNEAGLTHRDVKSSNVLLKCKCGGGSNSRLNCTCLSGGGTLRALVGDLGVSKRIAQDATVQMMYAEARAETFAGTPRWMAPERLAVSEGNLSGDLGGEEGGGGFSRASTFRGQESSSRLAGEKSDVYSFGILAWELLWYMYQGYYQVPFSEFDASSSFALGEYNSEFDNTEFETQEEARRVPGRGAAGPSRLVQSVQAAPTSAKDRRRLLASLSGRMGGTSPGSSKGTADSLGGSPPAALYDRILRGIRPTIPQCCDPRLRDLVKACWHGEATARPRLDVIQRTLEGLLASVATASLFE
jgi:serine/threonine protein kinase